MFKNLTYLEISKVTIAQVSKDEGIEIGLQQSTVHQLRFSLYDPNVCFISFPVLKGLVSSQLQVLEIHSTPAYKVEWTFFKNLPVSLNHLHLKNNHIIDVCFCGLFKLKNLTLLDLSHQNNQIDLQLGIICKHPKTDRKHDTISVYNHSEVKFIPNSIDCSSCQKLPVALRTIDISHSRLLCDLVKVFCDSSNLLEYLDISYQGKTDCFETFWIVTKNIVSLKYLNATENGLKIIFSAQPLENLTLHHNYLAIVDFNLQTQFLEYLDLSYNNILYLSNKLTDQLNTIEKHLNLVIYIEGSQLVCDCERLYFVAWLRYNSAIHKKDQITCKIIIWKAQGGPQ